MAADWEEVKRLAADFQKAQLSSTLQRLSDRNCIEIVTKLIECNLLEVVFTTDGKEYLTPQQVRREIKEELYVRGGRVNLVDLAKDLNLEFAQVSLRAAEVCQTERGVRLVLGQLIDAAYAARLAADINQRLAQLGQVTVGELTLLYDLPADFLLPLVERQLGKAIKARQDPADPSVFFTDAFVARSKAKIRGALAALSRPTPVGAILGQCEVSERLFFSLLREVAQAGAVSGKQAGAPYVPHVYSRSQLQWVAESYRRGGYLEYDALVRMGISDPKGFIRRTLPDEEMSFLQSCVVGTQISDQVVTAVEECEASGSFVDVSALLPSVISEADMETLIARAVTPALQKNLLIFGSTVVSTSFVDKLSIPCYDVVNEKAKKFVESGAYQRLQAERQLSSSKTADIDISSHVDLKAERRDERRRKAAGGKVGGGTQGRETKTKAVKKHVRGKQGAGSDSEDEAAAPRRTRPAALELITTKEIKKCIQGILEEDGLEDLAEDIALHILPSVNKIGVATAQKIFEATLENSSQHKRQTHSSLQDKLNIQINDIRHYEKGIKVFQAEQQPQFVKYLLKTLGSDIASEFFQYAAGECGLQVSNEALNAEQRNKLLSEVSEEYKGVLATLNRSLLGPSVEDFLKAAENCVDTCSMVMKKIDKKKDRSLVLSHKHGLLEQLQGCTEPALVLHLAALAIFSTATQTMLHASGRQVATILTFLRPSLSEEEKSQLSLYHDLVLKMLGMEEDNAEKNDVIKMLNEKIVTIKKISANFKKPTSLTSQPSET